MDLLVGLLRQRVDSASGFVGQKATEQGSYDHTFTKVERQQAERASRTRWQVAVGFARIASSLVACPSAAPAGVSCTSSQCIKKLEMRTLNALDARLGQGRVCPGGGGERAQHQC